MNNQSYYNQKLKQIEEEFTAESAYKYDYDPKGKTSLQIDPQELENFARQRLNDLTHMTIPYHTKLPPFNVTIKSNYSNQLKELNVKKEEPIQNYQAEMQKIEPVQEVKSPEKSVSQRNGTYFNNSERLLIEKRLNELKNVYNSSLNNVKDSVQRIKNEFVRDQAQLEQELQRLKQQNQLIQQQRNLDYMKIKDINENYYFKSLLNDISDLNLKEALNRNLTIEQRQKSKKEFNFDLYKNNSTILFKDSSYGVIKQPQKNSKFFFTSKLMPINKDYGQGQKYKFWSKILKSYQNDNICPKLISQNQ